MFSPKQAQQAQQVTAILILPSHQAQAIDKHIAIPKSTDDQLSMQKKERRA
jgi:hypothetical protein